MGKGEKKRKWGREEEFKNVPRVSSGLWLSKFEKSHSRVVDEMIENDSNMFYKENFEINCHWDQL